MVLRVAAARDPFNLAVSRLIWAVVVSVILAVGATPEAHALLTRWDLDTWVASESSCEISQPSSHYWELPSPTTK